MTNNAEFIERSPQSELEQIRTILEKGAEEFAGEDNAWDEDLSKLSRRIQKALSDPTLDFTAVEQLKKESYLLMSNAEDRGRKMAA